MERTARMINSPPSNHQIKWSSSIPLDHEVVSTVYRHEIESALSVQQTRLKGVFVVRIGAPSGDH